jgi:hypothetical protein
MFREKARRGLLISRYPHALPPHSITFAREVLSMSILKGHPGIPQITWPSLGLFFFPPSIFPSVRRWCRTADRHPVRPAGCASSPDGAKRGRTPHCYRPPAQLPMALAEQCMPPSPAIRANRMPSAPVPLLFSAPVLADEIKTCLQPSLPLAAADPDGYPLERICFFPWV